MKDVRLRVLVSPSLKDDERAAAVRGAHSFSSYGVKCEDAVIGKETLKDVRYKAFVRDVVTTPERTLTSDLSSRILDIIKEVFFTKGVMAIGVTDSKIYRRDGGMRREQIGAGLFASCAFISTSQFASLPADLRLKAIETAAKHEIGHVLMDVDGSESHCKSERCVMRDGDKSVERFLEGVRLELGFCSSCSGAISRGVVTIGSGALIRGANDSLFD